MSCRHTDTPIQAESEVLAIGRADPWPCSGIGLDVHCSVVLDQIRSVDKPRQARRVGRVDAEEMLRVDEALKVRLGLAPT